MTKNRMSKLWTMKNKMMGVMLVMITRKEGDDGD